MNNKKLQKSLKKKKNNALVLCRDGSKFWTTQKQFWQWAREGVVSKTADNPLTGQFVRQNEEKLIVLGKTILNLACPNHLREQRIQDRLSRSK